MLIGPAAKIETALRDFNYTIEIEIARFKIIVAYHLAPTI